jgi:dTDP-glucose 4,6-dehydratase
MIEIGPDRPGHDRRYLLDSSLIRAELGWSPQMDFDRGLADTADRRAGHREWRQPLRSRTPVDERAWTPVA